MPFPICRMTAAPLQFTTGWSGQMYGLPTDAYVSCRAVRSSENKERGGRQSCESRRLIRTANKKENSKTINLPSEFPSSSIRLSAYPLRRCCSSCRPVGCLAASRSVGHAGRKKTHAYAACHRLKKVVSLPAAMPVGRPLAAIGKWSLSIIRRICMRRQLLFRGWQHLCACNIYYSDVDRPRKTDPAPAAE